MPRVPAPARDETTSLKPPLDRSDQGGAMDWSKNSTSGERYAKVETAECGDASTTSQTNPLAADDDDAAGGLSTRVTFEVVESDDEAEHADNDAACGGDDAAYFQLTQPDPDDCDVPPPDAAAVAPARVQGSKGVIQKRSVEPKDVREVAARAGDSNILDEYAPPRGVPSCGAPERVQESLLDPGVGSLPRARKKIRTEGESGLTTHVFLLLDRSGSMRERDVGGTGSAATTRYDAVFQASAELVRAQAALHGAAVDFSLMLWSDAAEWAFRDRPAAACLDGLERARRDRPPRGGTNFSDPFRLLRGAIGGKFDSSRSQAVVIFLSDGRPGDLRPQPPKAHEAVQRTYASHGRRYDSCAVHLQALRHRVAALHFVGIHASGFPWLRWLAKHYDGQFHQSSLELGPVSVAPTVTRTASQSNPAPAAAQRSPSPAAGAQSDDDAVEFLRSVSAEERIRNNIANADVFTVQSQTQSSIRNTFLSLSQSITAVHETASQRA